MQVFEVVGVVGEGAVEDGVDRAKLGGVARKTQKRCSTERGFVKKLKQR